MKTVILILAAILVFTNIQAQVTSKTETESSETPTVVVKQFKKDFPAYNPIWSKDGFNYRADYTDPTTNMAGMVVYNKYGRQLKSETEMQANSYPGSIRDYYTTNLPSRTRYKVFSRKDTTGAQSYYTTSEGETYYFDKDGNYVSGTKKP